jgi:hypothetical protein
MKIGEVHQTFGPPIGNVKLLLSKANSYVADVASVWYLPTQGASERHYIGAPMSPSANRQC